MQSKRDAQNEELGGSTVSSKSSLSSGKAGCVKEGIFRWQKKLSKGPEVGQYKVGTSIACLEMRKVIDLAED